MVSFSFAQLNFDKQQTFILYMLLFFSTARLVNGFVENPHKKTGRSISELAEAVGIPRVLVDIRHG
jgi:ribosomal biogenesis protein LAS1